MTAARQSFDYSAGRLGTASKRWYPLQGGLLGVALAAFAVLMYVGAAPGGAALRSSPPASSADVGGSASQPRPSPAIASPSVPRHLVLLVSDPELGSMLQRRILAGELVISEFGAAATPLTVEVVVATADDPLRGLTDGLREFEARCVAEPCAALYVLDLRAPLAE